MEPPEKGKTTIPLNSLLGQSAQSLFPDLFQDKPAATKPPPAKAKPHKVIVPPPEFYDTVAEPAKRKPYKVIDPPLPDRSWLDDIADGQQDQAGDVPHALVALGEQEQPELMEQRLAKMGYAVTTASSAMQAIERLGLKKYHLVVCRADAAFEAVRRFVDRLGADRRRRTYFVLVGADLHTLYDQEALALRANLVINDRDLPSLELILRKGLNDYELLFRPLLDVLETSSHLK